MVIFLAEKQSGRPNLSTANVAVKWLKIEELEQLPHYILDDSTAELIKGVHRDRDNVPLCPKEVLVHDHGSSGRFRDKRRESEACEDRSPIVGVQSLEEKMLKQSGYGVYGKAVCVRWFVGGMISLLILFLFKTWQYTCASVQHNIHTLLGL